MTVISQWDEQTQKGMRRNYCSIQALMEVKSISTMNGYWLLPEKCVNTNVCAGLILLLNKMSVCSFFWQQINIEYPIRANDQVLITVYTRSIDQLFCFVWKDSWQLAREKMHLTLPLLWKVYIIAIMRDLESIFCLFLRTYIKLFSGVR